MPTAFVELRVPPQIKVDLSSDLAADESVRDRVFAITENLIAFVSVGPLCPGHTLICPRFPSSCIGEVVSDAHIQAEFSEFLSDVIKLLSRVYGGEILLFEHGGSSDLRPIGSSVLHAHLHVVPGVGIDAIDRLVRSATAFVCNREFGWEQVKSVLSTKFPAATWQDYLFLSADNFSWLARVGADQVVPDQYLRQAVAEALGNSCWDWRKWPNIRVVEESLQQIAEVLRSYPTKRLAMENQLFSSPFSRVDFD